MQDYRILKTYPTANVFLIIVYLFYIRKWFLHSACWKKNIYVGRNGKNWLLNKYPIDGNWLYNKRVKLYNYYYWRLTAREKYSISCRISIAKRQSFQRSQITHRSIFLFSWLPAINNKKLLIEYCTYIQYPIIPCNQHRWRYLSFFFAFIGVFVICSLWSTKWSNLHVYCFSQLLCIFTAWKSIGYK